MPAGNARLTQNTGAKLFSVLTFNLLGIYIANSYSSLCPYFAFLMDTAAAQVSVCTAC